MMNVVSGGEIRQVKKERRGVTKGLPGPCKRTLVVVGVNNELDVVDPSAWSFCQELLANDMEAHPRGNSRALRPVT